MVGWKTLAVCGTLTCVVALGFAWATPQQVAAQDAAGHAAHAHQHAEPMPLDDFVRHDAMRLIAMQFGTLRTESGNIADPETRAKLVGVTRDAQRYMRIVQRRWAPDRGFQKYAEAFQAAWASAESVAQTGDTAAVDAAVRAIGPTCKSCHEVYRENQ